MGKRQIVDSGLIIFIILIVTQLPGCSTDSAYSSLVYPKGKGTESNPFHVTSVHQLQAIDVPEHLNMHYIQMGDIDASESHEFQNGSGWKEIGTRETPFTGSYNGNGYVIRDLKLHEQRGGPSRGVWGYVKNARIENVFVDNSDQVLRKSLDDHYLFGSDDHYLFGSNEQSIVSKTSISAEIDLSEVVGIGGLVGFNDGGEIINCRFHGRVGAYGTPAGLVGVNTGLIENSHFKGSTSGFGGVGFSGINTGKIIDSSAEIRSGGMSAHGFVILNYGEIIRSSAQVDLNPSFFSAGLVSNNYGGRIESSFVTGEVRSRRSAAGFVINNSGVIENSYSNVNVSINYLDGDNFSVSGFVFENSEEGEIENSYATGTVIATGAEAELSAVIKTNNGSVKSVYWDMDSIGYEAAVFEGSSAGITGLTTDQITGTSARQFMPEFDWDTVWRTTVNYPVLRWQQEK